MRNSITFFLLFCVIIIKSQIVSGLIITENNIAVKDVNVYLDGSKIHTISTQDGNFSLDIQGQKIGVLVFQKEGYESNSIKISDCIGKKVKVFMNKIQDIEEVIIAPYTEDAYKKYIKYFLNQFIGRDQENVIIKNQKSLKFSYDKTNKILRVKSPKTLIIENKKLGYTIQYDLIDFESNFNNNMVFFSGTSYFIEENNKLKTQANRNNAYSGSLLNFFRSVYQNKMSDEGFWVNHIVRTENSKYPSDEELAKLSDFLRSNKTRENLVFPSEIKDIIERKRENKYYLALTRTMLPTSEFIQIKEGKTYLTFKDILQVNFKKYLFFVDKNKIEKSSTSSTQTSYIHVDNNVFEIYPDGNSANPEDMVLEGELFNRKIEDLLPLDFVPLE